MTREEAKSRAELYSALAEGKSVQVQGIDGSWVDVDIDKLNYFIETPIFRIKPEPKYRPFKNQEECWNEMLKHQPLGWLRSKRIKDIYQLITIRNHEIRIFADLPLRFSRAYREYEFLDGTPFGIKEE